MVCEWQDAGASGKGGSLLAPDVVEASDVKPGLDVSSVSEKGGPDIRVGKELSPSMDAKSPAPVDPGLRPTNISVVDIKPGTETPEEEE
jgi:hypothetical protein